MLVVKENPSKTNHSSADDDSCLSSKTEDLAIDPRYSSDKEAGLPLCRVCQCVESDRRGDAAIGFLGITPPLQETHKSKASATADGEKCREDAEGHFPNESNGRDYEFVEVISPEGEVFICNTDIEMGAWQQQDVLVELGCSCKNDLALVHYACALKWFVSHGSTVCEICGQVAKNIRTVDFRKVVASLKDYEELRERTAVGDPNPLPVNRNSGIDPDAVAAIRRQRLSEIALWFGPPNNTSINNNNNSIESSQAVSEQPLSTSNESHINAENRVTRWAVEGTGILLATGLLTVTLAWLIAPRFGKKTAKSGLHILPGALAVVVFIRIVVANRISYGPVRYWAILFFFWFLVLGVWAHYRP